MSGGSGPKSSASFARWDRATSCWRTSQGSLLSTEGAFSEPFSGSWPSGSRIKVEAGSSSITVSRLPRSAHLTSAIASGFLRTQGWPTPIARDHRSGKTSETTAQRNSRPLNEVVVHHERALFAAAQPPAPVAGLETLTPAQGQFLLRGVGFWPTATATATDGVGSRRKTLDTDGGPNSHPGTTLLDAALLASFAVDGVKRWPTLLARDGNGPQRGANAQGGKSLSETVRDAQPRTPDNDDRQKGRVPYDHGGGYGETSDGETVWIADVPIPDDAFARDDARPVVTSGKPWPTPRASEGEDRQAVRTPSQEAGTHGRSLRAEVNAEAGHGARSPEGLPVWVEGEAAPDARTADGKPWPTPAASGLGDGEDPTKWRARYERHASKETGATRSGLLLGIAVQDESRITGQLNPAWVELLMGYPCGWTDPDRTTPCGPHPGWPAPMGRAPFTYEPPRLAPEDDDVTLRRGRIIALGNAVVPHCVTVAGARLLGL